MLKQRSERAKIVIQKKHTKVSKHNSQQIPVKLRHNNVKQHVFLSFTSIFCWKKKKHPPALDPPPPPTSLKTNITSPRISTVLAMRWSYAVDWCRMSCRSAASFVDKFWKEKKVSFCLIYVCIDVYKHNMCIQTVCTLFICKVYLYIIYFYNTLIFLYIINISFSHTPTFHHFAGKAGALPPRHLGTAFPPSVRRKKLTLAEGWAAWEKVQLVELTLGN